MFTGIIEDVGHIAAVTSTGNDLSMTIVSNSLDLGDVNLGDSIAINGVCLTVTSCNKTGFDVDVSAETLACTTFAALKTGDPVNLEKALLPTTRLGGHLVSGHVDGIGSVIASRNEGRSRRIDFELPSKLARYVAAKGSVCIDGVSLTINTVEGSVFSVNIIPHTQDNTIINHYKVGDQVNIEVDIIARYLERLLGMGDNDKAIDIAMLERSGFIDRH